MVRAGQVDALVLQDPFRMGELAVREAVNAVRGGDVGGYIDTGVHLLDAGNVDSAEMQELLKVDLEKWLGD